MFAFSTILSVLTAPHDVKNPITGLSHVITGALRPKKPWYDFLNRLVSTRRPAREVVAQVLGLAIISAAGYAHAVANVVDFYLDPAHAAELTAIQGIVAKSDSGSQETLRGYVREAQRAMFRPRPPVSVLTKYLGFIRSQPAIR